MDDHRQLRVLFWCTMLGGVVGIGIGMMVYWLIKSACKCLQAAFLYLLQAEITSRKSGQTRHHRRRIVAVRFSSRRNLCLWSPIAVVGICL